MPPRGSLKQAQEFAQKHGGWIAARLGRLPEPAPFAHGTVIPLRGVDHRIVHRPGQRGTVWIESDEQSGRLLCVAGAEPHVARRVADFLKREVKADLEAASRRAASALGVTFQRVSIRDQSSRWGSCSTTGVLSYSWRLIFAPPFVLDYLAAHEVAHLVEMNHSRPFWRVVERICPERRPRQGLARRARRRPASLRHAWPALARATTGHASAGERPAIHVLICGKAKDLDVRHKFTTGPAEGRSRLPGTMKEH